MLDKLKKVIKTNEFFAFIFLLPALIFFGVYMLIPIPLSTYYSLFDWSGIGQRSFAGLSNWVSLFSDSIFWAALLNNIRLVVISLVIQLPIALFLAILLTSKIKFSLFFKTVYFFPMLLSTVAIGIMWSYIYHPNLGLLNNILETLGLEAFIVGWLGSNYAIYSVIAAISWRFIPFHMILYMAGIVGIPVNLYESAEIDGANSWEKFRYITIPQLKPILKNSAVLSLVGSLKIFGEIFVLTDGGPNHASEVMATYMYKNAFRSMRMGYGSTIAVALFIIAFLASYIFLSFVNREQGGAGNAG